MTNPSSVSWAIEMFGYLFQGISFWLVYPALVAGRRGKLIKGLLAFNLLLSVAGAVAACIDVAWAMTPFGLLMFIVWNFVLALLMGIIAFNSRAMDR